MELQKKIVHAARRLAREHGLRNKAKRERKMATQRALLKLQELERKLQCAKRFQRPQQDHMDTRLARVIMWVKTALELLMSSHCRSRIHYTLSPTTIYYLIIIIRQSTTFFTFLKDAPLLPSILLTLHS